MQLQNKAPFAKGKRGIIFTAFYKGKKVCIKEKNPESTALCRIENEATFLKILNSKGIGSRFIDFKDEQLIREFVEGELILDFIAKNEKKIIIKVLKETFDQLYTMDKLGINKEEMHHPVKHIIVTKNNKPVLIDFERCHKTIKPKNVTQFCQFLIGKNVNALLKEKKIMINKENLICLAKIYKNNISKNKLDEILGTLK